MSTVPVTGQACLPARMGSICMSALLWPAGDGIRAAAGVGQWRARLVRGDCPQCAGVVCVCVCRLQHALPTLLTLCHLHAPSRCPACPLLRMLSPVGLATMNLPAVHALNLCYHDRPLYMSLRLSAPRLASHAAAVLC